MHTYLSADLIATNAEKLVVRLRAILDYSLEESECGREYGVVDFVKLSIS